jgi:hypothetical protein
VTILFEDERQDLFRSFVSTGRASCTWRTKVEESFHRTCEMRIGDILLICFLFYVVRVSDHARENTFRSRRELSRRSNVAGTGVGIFYFTVAGLKTEESVAFVEAYAAREDEDSGLAMLAIWYEITFDERNFILFLNQRNLECMELYHTRLRSEEACRAVAEAEVQCLELESTVWPTVGPHWSNLSGTDAAREDFVFAGTTIMTASMNGLHSTLRNGTSRSCEAIHTSRDWIS